MSACYDYQTKSIHSSNSSAIQATASSRLLSQAMCTKKTSPDKKWSGHATFFVESLRGMFLASKNARWMHLFDLFLLLFLVFPPECSWHLLLGIILKVSIDQHIQKQETVEDMQKNKSSKLESFASQDLDENNRCWDHKTSLGKKEASSNCPGTFFVHIGSDIFFTSDRRRDLAQFAKVVKLSKGWHHHQQLQRGHCQLVHCQFLATQKFATKWLVGQTLDFSCPTD